MVWPMLDAETIFQADEQLLAGIEEERARQLHVEDDGFEHLVHLVQRVDSSHKQRAAVLYCHGGGFAVGNPLGQLALQRYLAWRYDIMVVSTNYPLTGTDRFPRQMQMCANALRWMRSHAESLHIDPKRIAVMGASAGAYISGMISTTYADTDFAGGASRYAVSARPDLMIALWGPMDFVARWYDNGGQAGAEPNLFNGDYLTKPGAYHRGSVVNHVHPDVPQALFVQGREDPVVHQQQGVIGHAAWQEQGVPSELFLVDQIGHGPQSEDDRRLVYNKVSEYLMQQFALSPVAGTAAIQEKVVRS